MNRYLQRCVKLLIFISISFSAMTSMADLSVTIDRSVIDSNETFRLNVRYDGQVFTGEPNFIELENDFEILSNNRQQSYSSINGRTESFTTWVLQLRPKRTGILEIPSLDFKGDSSKEVELRVRAAPKNPSSNPGSQPIYSETLIDYTEAYVNQQIVLTQRLYTSVNLRDFSLSELNVDNAIVHRLGDTTYQKVLNGRSYLVLEVTYALFPKEVGKIDIPKQRFGAFEVNNSRQFGIFNNRGNQVIRDTEAKEIKVLPRSSKRTDEGWMPSKSVEIEQRWSGDLNGVTVGEPITQTITITAEGLTPEQITPLNFTESTKYRTYPDQPQLTKRLNNNGVIAQRVESRAIVPSQPGELVLPSVRLNWWDIEQNKERIAELPALILDVIPADETPVSLTGGPISSENSAESNVNTNAKNLEASKQNYLQTLTIASLILNTILIGIVFMIFQRRRMLKVVSNLSGPTKTLSADNILKLNFKKIERGARSRDLMSMREGILAWGKIICSDKSCNTLKKLAQKLEDTDISNQFIELDRELFRGDDKNESKLDCDLLLKRLEAKGTLMRKSHEPKTNIYELRDLYPT